MSLLTTSDLLRAYPVNATKEKSSAFAEAIGALYDASHVTVKFKFKNGEHGPPFRNSCMRRIRSGKHDDFRIAMKWAEQDTGYTAEELLAIKTLIYG